MLRAGYKRKDAEMLTNPMREFHTHRLARLASDFTLPYPQSCEPAARPALGSWAVVLLMALAPMVAGAAIYWLN
jgi:hypothetical protein